MATKKDDKPAEPMEAVLLRDCQFGKVGEVVTLDAADAAQAVEQGMADPHPDALAYAKQAATAA